MTTPIPLFLYDSYQKKIVEFNPSLTVTPGVIKMYSCGPTVYNYLHIGNLRATWLPETFARVSKIAGWQTQWVMNITDVGHLVGDGDEGQNISQAEDKIEMKARGDGKSVEEIVSHYTEDFLLQAKALNLNLPMGDLLPRATQYIEEQMILVLNLVIQKKAYILEDGIYFDSQSKEILGDNSYTGRNIANTTKHPEDFALWKFVTADTLQKWKFNEFDSTAQYMIDILTPSSPDSLMDLPNRYGTPGWHSECVAMICKIMNGNIPPITMGKDIIDVHFGGEDHIDIHHKNEILQSSASGFNLSTHWVHNKFVLMDSAKMSKSKGNIYRVITDNEDSIAGRNFDPLAYRLMLMEHHYTEQLNFTWDKLTVSQNRLFNLRKDFAQILSFAKNHDIQEGEIDTQKQQELLTPLTENLDTPLFFSRFQEFVGTVLSGVIKSQTLSENDLVMLKFWEQEFISLDLAPTIPTEIIELCEQRLLAKKDRNFQISDQLRDQLMKLSYQVDDYAWGYGIWKTKKPLN
jgi:cysteinyl-tRNA synthetase